MLLLKFQKALTGGDKSLDLKADFNGQTLSLRLKPLLEVKNNAKDATQFQLVNQYLHSRPEELSAKIFEQYSLLEDRVFETGGDISSKYVTVFVNGMLNLLDTDDIKNWLKNESKLIIPPRIAEVYKEEQVYGTGGSRDQTYIRDEYLDLVVMIMVSKLILPQLAAMSRLVIDRVAKNYRYLEIFKILKKHPIYKHPAIDKLYRYMNKIKESQLGDVTKQQSRIIETEVHTELLTEYLVADIFVSKLATLSVVNDTNESNAVSILYRAAGNNLKLKSSVKETIRPKTAGKSIEDEDESYLDSYRLKSPLSIGQILEADTYIENLQQLCVNMGVEVPDQKVLQGIVKAFQNNKVIHNDSGLRTIIKWVTAKIMDPRLNSSDIINMAAVTFLWLYQRGHFMLAYILTGTYPHEPIVSSRTSSVLTEEMRVKLLEIAPNNRVSGKYTIPVLEKAIISVDKDIGKTTLVTTFNSQLINLHFKDIYRETEGLVFKPSNLKVLLFNLILDIDKEL